MINLYREVRVSSQATSKRAPEETSSGARSAKERFGLRPASGVAEEDALPSPTQRYPKQSLGEYGAAARDDRRVVPPARLDRTLLRLVVDVNDAEPLGVAECPLVVVEQRPREVSTEIDPGFHRVMRSSEMLAIVLHAKRILDLAVDALRRIVKRRAVLRDVDGRIAVPLLHPHENFGQSFGEDFPVRLSGDALWLRNAMHSERLELAVVAGDTAGVVVEPEEIDRLFDQGHVLVRPVGPGLAEYLLHLFRVVAEENGIKILAIHVGIGAPGRIEILRRLRRRVLRLEVDRDSNLSLFPDT